MNGILIHALTQRGPIEKAIIESVDLALYRLLVVIDDKEVLVLEKENKPLVRHNQNSIRELLTPFTIKLLVLRHQSAFDEMVGQPPKAGSNRMEIPLGKDIYPELRTLH